MNEHHPEIPRRHLLHRGPSCLLAAGHSSNQHQNLEFSSDGESLRLIASESWTKPQPSQVIADFGGGHQVRTPAVPAMRNPERRLDVPPSRAVTAKPHPQEVGQ
jgi:hypothetical protein